MHAIAARPLSAAGLAPLSHRRSSAARRGPVVCKAKINKESFNFAALSASALLAMPANAKVAEVLAGEGTNGRYPFGISEPSLVVPFLIVGTVIWALYYNYVSSGGFEDEDSGLDL